MHKIRIQISNFSLGKSLDITFTKEDYEYILRDYYELVGKEAFESFIKGSSL